MSNIPRSTLEQWAVLRAIVDEGSFSAAATVLNRSQSSVSYAVARLREAIGVDLLVMDGRCATLTPAGAALLAETIPLIDALGNVERRGGGIADGEPVKLRLLIDMLFPRERLFDALSQFRQSYPGVDIHLEESVRQLPDNDILDRHDLSILLAPPGEVGDATVANIALCPVAAPRHPLAATVSPNLAGHIKVEIRGASPNAALHDVQRTWLMNTIEGAADAIRRGLCFGWLPVDAIRGDLSNGLLVPLKLAVGDSRIIHLNLYRGTTDAAASNAAMSLERLLRASG